MNTQIFNVTVGADPELFLSHGGKYISSVGLIGGSKENPLPVREVEGLFLQEDNVAVEFNISPSRASDEFVRKISQALVEVKRKVPHLDLELKAAAYFEEDQLNTEQARTFGCDPDFDAWSYGAQFQFPRLEGNLKALRTAGGHIHIGWDNPEPRQQLELVRAMDVFFSIPMAMIEPESPRRMLYGLAGCFRPKPYGVEYRTPSNFWLTKEEYMRFAFDSVMSSVEFLHSGKVVDPRDKSTVMRAINQSDPDAIKRLYLKYLNK